MSAMRKVGDWARVKLLIRNIGGEMRKARHDSLVRVASKVEAIAVSHITLQDLPWKRLKPATVSAKIRKGESENILVATSTYFQSITSYVDKDTAYVGVKKGVRYNDGKEIADIARLHEYGSRSGAVPARKLWRPSLEEGMEWAAKNILVIVRGERDEKV